MQKTAFEKVQHGYGRLLFFCSICSGAIVALLGLLICANVVGRRFFNSPILGTLEITEFFMAFAIMLPMAYTQIRGGHLRVTLLSPIMPGAMARWIYVVGLVLGACLFAWASWATGDYALQSWRIGEQAWGAAFRIPVYPAKAAISLCTALLAIQFLLDALRIGLFGIVEKRDALDRSSIVKGLDDE